MEYNIPIKKEAYYLSMLKAVNWSLKLSKFQMEIICIILEDENKILTTDLRKLIRDITGKGIATTNNYIKKLKDRQILLESDEGLVLNQMILSLINDKEVTIRFNIN